MFPNAVLIGEAWMKGIKFNELKTININHKFLKWISGASSDNLLKEYIDELDGVLDFKLQELIRGYVVRGKLSKKEFYDKVKRHYRGYPKDYFLPTFLDNHDMDRFLYTCHDKKELLKEAIRIQFSIDQPKIIYYGTEVGMSQRKSTHEFTKHGDLRAREPMKWEKQDKELLKFYKNIIRINS